MRAIKEKPDFRIDGLGVGSGNAGDKETVAWLQKWRASGKEWPWFVKRSFKTIREMERKSGKPKKSIPPIKESLLCEEFVEEFNKGRLSVQSLGIVCPVCGSILKSVTFANFEKGGRRISELKCPSPECGRFVQDAGITLRYYCGYVVPDSSAIQRKIVSNDLKASRFFESFTVLLVPVVRKECDGTPRGRDEFNELRRFSAMGRIKLESVGEVQDVPNGLSSTARDEEVIRACLRYNGILLTADKSMSTFAVGKDVFTISI